MEKKYDIALIKLRREMKKKKPAFLRQDAHKVKRLKNKWRKPKGLHSKIRHKFKGYRTLVSKGYKSPAEVKGLSRNGMHMVVVSNVDELLKLNGKIQLAIIARSVGMRKRLLMIEKANENNITIMNINKQKDLREIWEKKQRGEKKDSNKTTNTTELGKEESK